MTLPGWLRSFLRSALPVALAGALLSRALAPHHDLWVIPVALGVLSWLVLRAETWRKGAALGWWFGLGYFGLGMSWIVEPFLVDPERHAWMAPFGILFLAGGLALFWGAAFGLAIRISPRNSTRRIAALIVLWSLAEFARAYVLTGFPWAAFGQFWIDTSLSGGLRWLGPHGLALVTLAGILPIPLVLLRQASMRIRGIGVAAPLALGALWVALSAGQAPVGQDGGNSAVTVRLIQPNAPQDQKWHPDHMHRFFQRQLDYTASPAAGPQPSLIVWPETAVPSLLEHAEFVLGKVTEAAGGTPVVLGMQRSEELRYYNSFVVLGSDGQVAGLYDKQHLVPFGEYVPFGDVMARFGIHGFAATSGAGFSAGPGPAVLDVPGIGQVLPLICYEAVFPQDVNGAPSRPDLLIQITNDAWFGTRSGPYQHLVQARMRAIEQGVPMVRAANTGVSAMIAPDGRVTHMLPLGQAGYLDAPLPQAGPPTIYSRTGDWPVLLFLLASMGGLLWAQRRFASLSCVVNKH
jgi:apolipoprotein N-acyltransferase